MATKNSASDAATVRADGVPEIDISLDDKLRPMTGLDIEKFRRIHRLSISDVANALALQSTAAYASACKQPILPIARELLIRLYYRHPNPPPWKLVSPADSFAMMYGDILKQWVGTDHYDDARIVLYGRFTAIFGRSVFNAYRWVEQGGRAKSEIGRVLAKLTTIQNPREALESVASLVLSVRGRSLDIEFPIPTADNPPRRHVRGRKPGQKVARKKVDLPNVAAADDQLPQSKTSRKGRVTLDQSTPLGALKVSIKRLDKEIAKKAEAVAKADSKASGKGGAKIHSPKPMAVKSSVEAKEKPAVAPKKPALKRGKLSK